MKHSFVHPCLSLILDIDENNWIKEFTTEGLEELWEYNKPLLRELPKELSTKLVEIFEQNSALDAYNFGRYIEPNPAPEPITAWLSQTISNTAKFFVKEGHPQH